jgi:hypothetical protein
MKEEYAEMVELLEPVLYSLPTVAEIIKKKSAEFGSQKEKGVMYSREQLLEEGMKSLGELVEYFVDQAGKKGLLGKFLAKKASTYFTKSLADMIFGSEMK